MTTEEIEEQLKPCRYCGNEHPQVFHQDYNGDNYDNSSTKNNILLSIYICNISYNG